MGVSFGSKEGAEMPWKMESVMEQRLRFVIDQHRGTESFSALCGRYQISRKTGYKWLERYRAAGSITGLKDKSRRPHRSPRRTSAESEQQVLAMRDEKGWGADKIHEVIAKKGVRLAAITIHRILGRHDKIKPESRVQQTTKRFARESCNELAQMDYKGEYVGRAEKCYPLSLLDDCSRYLLGLWPQTGTDAPGARKVLEAHFREQGVPLEMLMDHGSTWYSNNTEHGLTWLSVWLIKQGITLRYSGVHHPQTQGKVERLHGTFKRRTKHRGEPTTMREWATWLQEFRYEYNYERPHEALEMKTPAEVYTTQNLRPYQEQPAEWEYDGGTVRKLDHEGGFSKYGCWYFACQALAGERVRIDEFDGRLTVTFRHLTIREIDLQNRSSTAVLLRSEGHH